MSHIVTKQRTTCTLDESHLLEIVVTESFHLRLEYLHIKCRSSEKTGVGQETGWALKESHLTEYYRSIKRARSRHKRHVPLALETLMAEN